MPIDNNTWRARIALPKQHRVKKPKNTRYNPPHNHYDDIPVLQQPAEEQPVSPTWRLNRRSTAGILTALTALAVVGDLPLAAAVQTSKAPLRPRTAHRISEPASPEDVVYCTPEGVCDSKLEIIESKPPTLSSEYIKPKVRFTSPAIQHYLQSNGSSAVIAARTLVIQAIQNISASNPDHYCKLKTLFEHGLELVIMEPIDSMLFGAELSAMFISDENKIYIPIPTLTSGMLLSLLVHEAQHALVYYENLKNNNQVLNENGDLITSSVPCPFHNQKSPDCAALEKLLNTGEESQFLKLKKIIDKIDEAGFSALTEEEKEQYSVYEPLVQNYQPLRFQFQRTSALITKYQQAGQLDQQLNINPKNTLNGHLFLLHKRGSPPVYINEVTYRDGVYLLMAKNHYASSKLAFPFFDLAGLLDTYKDRDSVTQIVEKDACIHQIFSQTPELMNLLFPGLRDYHLERAGEEMQQCVTPTYGR